jgi:hypothetical protein
MTDGLYVPSIKTNMLIVVAGLGYFLGGYFVPTATTSSSDNSGSHHTVNVAISISIWIISRAK